MQFLGLIMKLILTEIDIRRVSQPDTPIWRSNIRSDDGLFGGVGGDSERESLASKSCKSLV